MGQFLPNPSDIPTSQLDDWVPLVNRDSAGFSGLNGITLTNWESGTVLPEIAAGSKIDIAGSIASFPIVEAFAGAPSDGTVYVSFVVVGDVITPTLTNTAPSWNAANNGWYNGPDRYSGHYMAKSGTTYTAKYKATDELNGFIYLPKAGDLSIPSGDLLVPAGLANVSGGIITNNVTLKQKYILSTRAAFATGVAHGLTMSKIICANASAQYSNGLWYGFPRDETYNNGIDWNNTTIIVSGVNTGYTAMKVLIWYEA